MASSAKVSHIVVCVPAADIDQAARDFTAALGLENLEGPFDRPLQGIRVYIDWDAGLELVAPINDAGAPLQAFLDDHGPGVLRVAFGVDNRDQALKRAEANGCRVEARYDFLKTFPEWANRFDFALESALGEMHGVRLNLCQIVPSAGLVIESN